MKILKMSILKKDLAHRTSSDYFKLIKKLFMFFAYSNDWCFKYNLIELKYELHKSILDILVNDSEYIIRMALAEKGYELDKLISDPHWEVRCAVVKKHYRLDILVDDPEFEVREEVAHQGYGLDKLVNDEYWEVRKQVAYHNHRLDILINDSHWQVRRAAKIVDR